MRLHARSTLWALSLLLSAVGLSWLAWGAQAERASLTQRGDQLRAASTTAPAAAFVSTSTVNSTAQGVTQANPTGSSSGTLGEARLSANTHNQLASAGRAGGSSALVPAASGCTTPRFSGPTNFGAGTAPRSVAVGDFNLDGKPDLAVANDNSADVSVLLGNGNGTFQAALNSSTGRSGPSSVAVGDFNLDGKPDLAVAYEFSNNVSVLLGNGNGSFQAALNFSSGGVAPASVAVGDFNLDGKPDLAVANLFSISVAVLLGNGNGSFQAAMNFNTGAIAPSSVAVGDFNLDGKPDLAVTNENPGNVGVLLGNGNGTFQAALNFGVGSTPTSVAVSDFNLDGKPDLAVANFGSTTVSVLLGNGNGSFQAALNFDVGAEPNTVVVGDFNLDGKLDLATANPFSNNASVLLGNGNGSFQAAVKLGVGSYPEFVVVGDFNLDGKPDLATNNAVSSNVSVLLNNCTTNTAPTITPIAITLTAGSPSANSQIAIAMDAEDAGNTLQITISNGGSFGNSASLNGVTVTLSDQNAGAAGSNPDATGKVFADVIATANATTATFTLRVTDSGGLFAEAMLTVTVVKYSGSVADPLACTGPGNLVAVTLVLGNTGATPLVVSDTTTFTNLVGVPGSCVVAPNVGTCNVTNTNLTYTALLAANQTVTITYLTQVADGTPSGAQICSNNAASFGGGPPISLSVCNTVTCPAVGPGASFPTTSEVSEQKAGSVLVYNLYSSSIAAPNTQNTRVSLTNTNLTLSIAVHLFFVDGATCSIADSLVCLTPNQTASFLASDIDPGTTGYIIAVASDRVTGCPINFNYLIGDEYVKFASGHAANLTAEAFAALAGGPVPCNANSVTTVLNFDGTSYNRAPRVLAASNIPSRADGNDTLIVLNRVGGSLAAGAATLGNLFGILYDDAENPLSFTFTAGVCQFRSSLSSSFPRTAPRFEQFIPAGRSGWAKFYSLADIGLLGAQLNFNANAGTAANAFNQGHNLHKLTLTSTAQLTIPIFPPNC